ncbi:MAG: SDR family NAD(P)-dependent oxidoreductase [Stappiaceae bacterium]
MGNETILITGASGCIGSWVLRHLVNEGRQIVASDLSDDKTRPELLLSAAELDTVNWVKLDVTDGESVSRVVREMSVTHIIHLAGLQVPFAKANPTLGAAVNVVGTVNIFEAARHNGVQGISYASSIAVFGPAAMYDGGPIPDNAKRAPDTLYGAYKLANEETARVYWQDWQVGSVGLRPGVVYGVARDQGISSDIAKALLAVAADRPFHIRFDGPVALQHASDVARMFIDCALANHKGSTVCSLRNDVIEVSDFVDIVSDAYSGARITREVGAPLPVPADYDDTNLRAVLGTVPHTPLKQAISADITAYKELVARNAIDLTQLDR